MGKIPILTHIFQLGRKHQLALGFHFRSFSREFSRFFQLPLVVLHLPSEGPKEEHQSGTPGVGGEFDSLGNPQKVAFCKGNGTPYFRQIEVGEILFQFGQMGRECNIRMSLRHQYLFMPLFFLIKSCARGLGWTNFRKRNVFLILQNWRSIKVVSKRWFDLEKWAVQSWPSWSPEWCSVFFGC